ncbi:MAG: GNAT family N-acetyltransferase [Candidatus Micrarchaeia archaeon]
MKNFPLKILNFYLPVRDSEKGIALYPENLLDLNINTIMRKDPSVCFSKTTNGNDYNILIMKKDKNEINIDKGLPIGGIILEPDKEYRADKENVNTIFINYWIEKGYRNKGFATKAVDLTCSILSKANSDFKINIKNIKAFINHDNLYSIKVVEACKFIEVEDPKYIKYGRTFVRSI